MSDHRFRVRFAIQGGHVHCRLFEAPNRIDVTWAKCGEFTVRKGTEFRDLMGSFAKAEFLGEDEKHGIVEATTP